MKIIIWRADWEVCGLDIFHSRYRSVTSYFKHGNGIVSVSEAEFVEDMGKYWLVESLPLKVVFLCTYVHCSADRSGCKLLLIDRTLCMSVCKNETTQNDR